MQKKQEDINKRIFGPSPLLRKIIGSPKEVEPDISEEEVDTEEETEDE